MRQRVVMVHGMPDRSWRVFFAFTFTVWRNVSSQRQRRPLSTMKDANADTEGFSDDVNGHCTASGCVAPEHVHAHARAVLRVRHVRVLAHLYSGGNVSALLGVRPPPDQWPTVRRAAQCGGVGSGLVLGVRRAPSCDVRRRAARSSALTSPRAATPTPRGLRMRRRRTPPQCTDAHECEAGNQRQVGDASPPRSRARARWPWRTSTPTAIPSMATRCRRRSRRSSRRPGEGADRLRQAVPRGRASRLLAGL